MLISSEASHYIAQIFFQDSPPVDPALAARSSHRRGRLATTSKEDIGRAAKICRWDEKRSNGYGMGVLVSERTW